jgi:hypothetical protein
MVTHSVFYKNKKKKLQYNRYSENNRIGANDGLDTRRTAAPSALGFNEAQTKRRLLALKINDLLNDIAYTLAIVEESEVAKRIIRSRITSIRTALADKTNAEIDAEVTQQIKEAEPTVAQRNTASKLIMEKNHDR